MQILLHLWNKNNNKKKEKKGKLANGQWTGMQKDLLVMDLHTICFVNNFRAVLIKTTIKINLKD